MRTTCTKHTKTKLVFFCPACRGGARSAKKAEASRENGKLGGRHKAEAVKIKRKPKLPGNK